jgi:hypothetical protein
MGLYEAATQAATYVYNWATGSSVLLGRSEFVSDFEIIYNDTVSYIFDESWVNFDSEFQGFIDEKVEGARAASDVFEKELKACKVHSCAGPIVQQNKQVLEEHVHEVACSQNDTLKQMTDAAVRNLIKNLKQTSLKIITDIANSARGCFECEGKRGSGPNSCLIDGVPVIPAANSDNIKADADIGKSGAEGGMKDSVENGKVIVADQSDKFKNKLDGLKEEFKKCSGPNPPHPHHSSSSSEEY